MEGFLWFLNNFGQYILQSKKQLEIFKSMRGSFLNNALSIHTTVSQTPSPLRHFLEAYTGKILQLSTSCPCWFRINAHNCSPIMWLIFNLQKKKKTSNSTVLTFKEVTYLSYCTWITIGGGTKAQHLQVHVSKLLVYQIGFGKSKFFASLCL